MSVPTLAELAARQVPLRQVQDLADTGILDALPRAVRKILVGIVDTFYNQLNRAKFSRRGLRLTDKIYTSRERAKRGRGWGQRFWYGRQNSGDNSSYTSEEHDRHGDFPSWGRSMLTARYNPDFPYQAGPTSGMRLRAYFQ